MNIGRSKKESLVNTSKDLLEKLHSERFLKTDWSRVSFPIHTNTKEKVEQSTNIPWK